ncbi:MAG: hypothetical protein VW932_04420 [Flavobacteriaceae bacterium]|jgi:hypothetical protein|nr:hypothetical protein [Flavobacteriaceae bacterium]PTM04944.1 MAG: hypothetical protein DA439_05400 [Bacteroidota bacterium]
MKIPSLSFTFRIAFSRRFERIADQVLFRSKHVPERNPQKEDLITPGIDTIRKLVSEIEK